MHFTYICLTLRGSLCRLSVIACMKHLAGALAPLKKVATVREHLRKQGRCSPTAGIRPRSAKLEITFAKIATVTAKIDF